MGAYKWHWSSGTESREYKVCERRIVPMKEVWRVIEERYFINIFEFWNILHKLIHKNSSLVCTFMNRVKYSKENIPRLINIGSLNGERQRVGTEPIFVLIHLLYCFTYYKYSHYN